MNENHVQELEDMKRYIRDTGFNNKAYHLRFHQALALRDAVELHPVEIIALSFEYGRAKGYRAGRSEARA